MRVRWRHSRARRDQRGSVLMLVPAGFLVLILLGGVSVDSAVLVLGQRQLADITAAAANDAATEGLSDASFYRSGAIVIDPTAAATAICADVAAQQDGDLHGVALSVAVDGAVVTVRASAVVDAVFGRRLPAIATRRVTAVASAEAAQGPTGAINAVPGGQPVRCTG